MHPRAHAEPAQIYAILEATYPDATCELEFTNAFTLLGATILSAQCTDTRVNMVTPALFAAYPDAFALAAARQEDVEETVRTTGFFRTKAKNLIAMARALVERHGGEVPDTMRALVVLPGVGRKTANVVLGNAFGKNEGITVDTHVLRVANRLGLAESDDPVRVERTLMALFPRERWAMLSHLMIFHGRRVCDARRPRCEICPLSARLPVVDRMRHATPPGHPPTTNPISAPEKLRRFDYRALAAFYRALFPSDAPPTPLDPAAVRRLLLVRHDAIGDMVVTLPAIAYLRALLPHADVDVLASPRNASLLDGDARVSHVYVNDHRSTTWPRIVRTLRRRHYDLILSPIGSRGLREGLFAAAVADRHTVRASLPRRAQYVALFTHYAPPVDRSEPIAARMLTFVAEFIRRPPRCRHRASSGGPLTCAVTATPTRASARSSTRSGRDRSSR